jgi:hypothetical protein
MKIERTPDGVVRRGGPVRPTVLAAAAVVFAVLLGVAGWIALQPGEARSAVPVESRHPPEPAGPAPALPPDPLQRAMLKALPPAPSAQQGYGEEDAPFEPQEIFVNQLPPGDGTGLDAFPRPGEKPIQRGLIVPDGYNLPPGFVRHHQTTDEGEQLPPILKFHPDHLPPGAPDDQVVPPDLAPGDMPQTWLEPPPPTRRR